MIEASIASRPRAAMRELGSVILASHFSCGERHAGLSKRVDAVAICLPNTPLADGIIVDLVGGADLPRKFTHGPVLLAPRRLLPNRLNRCVVDRVPASAALASAARVATALLAADMRLSEPQAQLAGRAMLDLLAAALEPPGGASGPAPRREASLLERMIVELDGRLAGELDIATLCSTLHCSRSALYRAAAPMRGVAQLFDSRRLASVHRRLGDPAEDGSIAAVARAHGFGDAARFSRSFRRRYGMTASTWRRSQRGAND